MATIGRPKIHFKTVDSALPVDEQIERFSGDFHKFIFARLLSLYKCYIPIDILEEAAWAGLETCWLKYDETRGASFATFITGYGYKYAIDELRRQWHIIRHSPNRSQRGVDRQTRIRNASSLDKYVKELDVGTSNNACLSIIDDERPALRDALKKCIQREVIDDMEAKILSLSMHGYTFVEIGRLIRYGSGWVSHRRSKALEKIRIAHEEGIIDIKELV